MSETTINVAVVGCGYWGPNLIRNFDRLDGVEVLWACDVRPERREHVAERFPRLRTTSSVDDIAEDSRVDAVAVATPVRTHHSISRRMLMAGKHVLVEKPLARTSAECENLIQIADARNLTLMVGHTFLYSPPVVRMKEIVESGEIGEILYISSRRLNLGLFREDINVLWDLAPHDISIILYLTGREPDSVNCQGRAQYLEGVEDFVSTSLTFDDGSFATIQSSWLDPNKVREMTIVGSEKMIRYDDTEQHEKIRIYDKRVDVPRDYDTFAEFHQAYHYGDMWAPHLDHDEPLRVECAHFVDCVRREARPRTDGRNGLDVVRILEAASRSLENRGRRVEISAGDRPQMATSSQ